MLGKNHVPNPCFKQQFNEGVPDFYMPYYCEGFDPNGGKQGSSWYLDDKTPWNGTPSLCMESHPCAWSTLESSTALTRAIFGMCYPPATDKPFKMVFSFYAKSAKDGDSVRCAFFGRSLGKTFPLTTEWKRYQATGDFPPSDKANDGENLQISVSPAGATVWISGLQLEAGETATEFHDDSVIEEK